MWQGTPEEQAEAKKWMDEHGDQLNDLKERSDLQSGVFDSFDNLERSLGPGVLWQPLDQMQLELRELIDYALEALTPEHRDLIEMYYFERLSQEQIAKHLNKSQQAVSLQLKTAEQNVAAALISMEDTNHE